MRNVNVVIVSGRLAADPEMRATPSGTSVCNFRIACNDSVKNAAGEYEDRANWFAVDAFSGLADVCGKYLERGQAVTVSGRLRWRSWEAQDGQKRSAVSIVADLVEFGAKAKGAGDAFSQAKDMVREAQAAPVETAADVDDDVPW